MRSNQLFENKFLIVDAKSFSRDTLRRQLLSFGADRVDVAASAAAAINMCRDLEYDVVLSDYVLGEGRNGRQLLQELRAEKYLKNVSAFIMLTSETTREVVLSTMEYEPDDYIVKPYMQSLLLNRINRLLQYKSIFHDAFKALDVSNIKQAIQWCNEYINDKDEYLSYARRLLGELCYQEKTFDEALKVYDKELVVHDNDWARMGVARVYVEQGRLSEAEALFLQLIESNYLYIEAYEYLSEIYIKQNQLGQAEEIMAKATLISPLSKKYKNRYARLCEQNNHYEPAINSWKQLVKSAKNSEAEEVDARLNLSRSLTNSCEYDDSYHNNDFATQALENLEKIKVAHSAYGDAKLQGKLIEARLLHGQGDREKAESVIQEVASIYISSPDDCSASTKLELAKYYSQSGNEPRAKEILIDLAATCHNVDILLEADKVLDGPVSERGKRRILELNREGVKHFKANKYTLAAKSFRLAITYFPKNIELNINIIQTLLKLIKSIGDDVDVDDMVLEGEGYINKLSDLSAEHEKYNFYQRLKKEFNMLQKSAA